MGIPKRCGAIEAYLEGVRDMDSLVIHNTLLAGSIDDLQAVAKALCDDAKSEIDNIKSEIDGWD